MGMWRRHRKAASAGLSAAALYSVYHGLYSEAVVSSVASAVALAEVGQFKKAVQYLQKAAKALYEAAKVVFEHVKVTVQRFVELFVEAVTRVLAWVDKHKAYPYLMAAEAVALAAALNMWGLIELDKLAHAAMDNMWGMIEQEKLAYFAVGMLPFFVGLADTGEKAAERFRALAERYEKWKIDERLIDGVLKAPLKGERPYTAFLKLAESANLPWPLVELRKALARIKGEAERDAAVVAALVLYKTLVKNAKAYGEWAGWYEWARRLVEGQKFAVAAEEVERLRGAQKRLGEAAGQVRRELNSVLTLYSQKRDLYEKLKQHLEMDEEKAEELAEARSDKWRRHSNASMGTKAYAALLSIARGGIYGHVAVSLASEGVLADIVLSTPRTAYDKAKWAARGRGEAVDPSRSPKGAVDWKDRAASVLLRFLIGYGEIDPQLLSGAGEADLKFRRVEKGDRKGFQVFRVYGGVEAPVGELWIGKTAAYFKVSKEGPRHLVEEAKETAPDLSGLDRSRQYLAWRATDVTTSRRQIVGATVHSWQLRWYIALLGGPDSFSGSASVTKEGIKFLITAYWPREREVQILRESSWLESLLGRRVESWRELVDAIDWGWVLERVEELVAELKPWIGPEKMDDAERKRLVKRMLDELALFVHFAEARRDKNDGRWRAERAVKLAKAVEALSGGRIAGEYAERLANAIIYYAEGYKKEAGKRIKDLAGKVRISMEELRGIVEFVLSDMYCLARDCARDEVVRKFVEPALELMMLDKALRGEFDKEKALLYFGEMYATAAAGDGTVESKRVELAVGGELGGGAALLRLAALHLLSQLLPKELKFYARIYVKKDRYYDIATYGEDAARFMHLLAVSAPSAGGGYLSEKFKKFVEEAQVEVRLDNIRQTKKGHVVADLTLSVAGVAVKYNVYLHEHDISLEFESTDRSRAELAARLLRLAGVAAEVKKREGGDVWYVRAFTNKLAAGREELRGAIAEVVKTAIKNGRVDAGRAERWLKKLEEGRVLMEGWPRYSVGLAKGALMVRFSSTNSGNIEREAQRLREMGLEEDRHFTVKMPVEGRFGYVSILREGLAYAAWLSVHGEGELRELAAEFVRYILRRAWEAGKEVYEKAGEIVDEGRRREAP